MLRPEDRLLAPTGVLRAFVQLGFQVFFKGSSAARIQTLARFSRRGRERSAAERYPHGSLRTTEALSVLVCPAALIACISPTSPARLAPKARKADYLLKYECPHFHIDGTNDVIYEFPHYEKTSE